LFSGTE